MRDRSGWHRRPAAELKKVWPDDARDVAPGDLLDVELGLYLLNRVMPGRPAIDAWTLFGGYPYSEAFGDVTTDEQRLMIRRARHYLWDMRRRRAWQRAVEGYLTVPVQYRGYELARIDEVPERLDPAHAGGRFHDFELLLSTPPVFERQKLPVATAGEYWFPVRDRRYSVVFTEDLLDGSPRQGHDIEAAPLGGGEPIEADWKELEAAAAEMDSIEADDPDCAKNQWAHRLARVKLLVRDEQAGRFAPSRTLRIDSLLNLVGMVGAGKSTLRDILTYWAAKRGLRVTLVVGDVAEELAIVELFRVLKIEAAPIIGHSTREKHIQRLHRRVATAGAPSMLAHEHSGFTHLSSACALDALRGLNAAAPLRIGEAPCQQLYPVKATTAPSVRSALQGDEEDDAPRIERGDPLPKRHLCPLWTRCPRHHSARELVDTQVWVANPASMVHSGIPQHLNDERLRYLELACRRSDLVIVDEADRVQMQLDTAFAPSTTLVGRSPNSWLDEVAGHKIEELARHGRIQLSASEVESWTSAVNTVTVATDNLYARLVRDEQLRAWITEDYFSALTLHQWLISRWFPDLNEGDSAPPPPTGTTLEERREKREEVSAVLDRLRDNPLRHHPVEPADSIANVLVHLTLELLHAQGSVQTTERSRAALRQLMDNDPEIEEDIDLHVTRFEFTLLLAVLHHRLDAMTMSWPRVEAALNLERTSNVLARRPPKDFEAIIPESPMGNVLGFQFQRGERNRDGDQSGELRFFRCSGVGRELLLALPEMPRVDGRPAPNVMLMSATSWAAESSRYHVHYPVGAVLRPNDDEVAAVLRSTFRKEFLYWPTDGDRNGGALRLSGSDVEKRPNVLKEMLRQLAVPDRSLVDATSRFDQELADIDDPERKRLLLLVGSYAEAQRAVEYLDNLPEWKGRVTQLISDDADLDGTWTTLRRGDIAGFPRTTGEILVAPLLAVERGHNIVVPGGKAAIGAVYFLARPHPRPDDIALAIQAINDWAVRQIRYGDFHQAALAAGTPDAAGRAFRREARQKWNRFLTRRLAWSSLPDDEKRAFTWDQLVVIWQVIGRLVRGGVEARAIFVDAAFSPLEAGDKAIDTPETSLLASMKAVLAPYFDDRSAIPAIDRSLVEALYEPLYKALADMD
jgi:hypothetical protein